MARIKTVYPKDMVCHLWANRHPHAIRTATGNLSAASGRLYSYGGGYVIAAFMDSPAKGGAPFILWNDCSYSATTNNQTARAWRALSATQRQTICRVPMMRDGDLRNLPGLAMACIKAAVEPLEKSDKARDRRDSYISDARRWLADAVRIYQYVGDKKAAAAVPTIPADPDKEKVKLILRQINRAEYLKAAADYASRAADAHHSAAMRAADRLSGGHSSARGVCERARDAVGYCERAEHEYKKAGARIPATVRNTRAAAQSLLTQFGPDALAESLAEQRAEIANTERGILWNLYSIREAKKNGPRFITLSSGRRLPRGSVYTLSHILNNSAGGPFGYAALTDGAAQLWPDETQRAERVKTLAALETRARRIIAADAIERAIKDTAEQCAAFEPNGPAHYSPPSARAINQAMAQFSIANEKGGSFNNAAVLYWQKKAAPVIALAQSLAEQRAAIVRERNAAAIEEWRAGGRVSVPRDCPIMARIVGDTVQTSWGASVPLEHAARLVRIARRVAAAGGQSWPDGAGPIVGHFRVQSIGPDLSAVIGCHEFTAAEANRAADAIDAATVNCAAVAE